MRLHVRLRAPFVAIAALVLVTPLHAQLTEGIDVSRFQSAIDWNDVSAAGKKFAFIRATRGEGYVDPLFLANIRGASAAGIPAGPYHFARLNTNEANPTADATNEANHFLSVIEPYYESGKFLPPVVDIEASGFPSSPTATKISNWTQTFSDTIFAALGIRPIIYTSESPANTYFTSAIASTHELWAAKYSATPPSTPLWGPYQFWQYTDSGSVDGISGDVDLDRFNGNLSQLNAILHGSGDVGGLPGGGIVLTNFDGADSDSTETEGIEGYFSDSPGFFSGSNANVSSSTTTATRSTAEAQAGPASQRILIDATNSAIPWTFRHVSGHGATPSSPEANLPLDTTGDLSGVGFWLNTTSANVTVQLWIDEATPVGTEVSTIKNVIDDGEWHFYKWDFADATQWNAFTGSSNGAINSPVVTIDSIVFRGLAGAGDATIYLDTVIAIPEPSTLFLAASAAAIGWRRRRFGR